MQSITNETEEIVDQDIFLVLLVPVCYFQYIYMVVFNNTSVFGTLLVGQQVKDRVRVNVKACHPASY
jgi:hypothetical protein